MFDYRTISRITIRPIEFDWFLVRFVRLATEPESKPQEFKRWSIHTPVLVIFLLRHSRQYFALKKLFEGTSVKRRYVSKEFNCQRISEMASMFCWEELRSYTVAWFTFLLRETCLFVDWVFHSPKVICVWQFVSNQRCGMINSCLANSPSAYFIIQSYTPLITFVCAYRTSFGPLVRSNSRLFLCGQSLWWLFELATKIQTKCTIGIRPDTTTLVISSEKR